VMFLGADEDSLLHGRTTLLLTADG